MDQSRLDKRGEAIEVDVGEAYEQSVRGWLALVDAVGGGWDRLTPCQDWDVRALVNHVVGEDRWTTPLVEGLTIADVGSSLDGDLLGDDPRQSARAAAESALAAVAARLPVDGTVQLSYGEERLEEYVRQLIADHLIHGWDLAAATGQPRGLDPGVAREVANWFIEREEAYRAAGAIGPRPEGPEDEEPQDRLIRAFGRDPRWAAD